jgi:hypothetical protein
MTFGRKILITIFAVAGFYAGASLLSRSFRYDYSGLVSTSFIIYMAAGYLGGRRRGIKCGMLLGSMAGFIDSTIGWFISLMIRPFTEMTIPRPDLASIEMMVFTTTTMGFVFGLIGAGLWKALYPSAPDAPG